MSSSALRNMRTYVALSRHLDFAREVALQEDFHVLGVFLYGSQNYQLDSQDSDVDTIVLCVPTLRRLILGKSLISLDHTLPFGEKQVIWDLRHYFGSLKKQSSGSLEILCTPYNMFVGDSESLLKPIFEHRDQIAHYDPQRFKTHIWGSITNELGRYHKGMQEDTIKSTKYAWKSLSHVVRYLDLYQALAIDGKSLDDSQIPARKALIQEIKQGFASFDILDAVVAEAQEFLAHNRPVKPDAVWIPNEIDKLLEDTLIRVYTKIYGVHTSYFDEA